MPEQRTPPRDFPAREQATRHKQAQKPDPGRQDAALREALMMRWLPKNMPEAFPGFINVHDVEAGTMGPQRVDGSLATMPGTTGEAYNKLSPLLRELVMRSAEAKRNQPIGEYDDDNNFIPIKVGP